MKPNKCKGCEYLDWDDIDDGETNGVSYSCSAPKDEDGKRPCERRRDD